MRRLTAFAAFGLVSLLATFPAVAKENTSKTEQCLNVGKTVGVISGAEQDCDIQESNKLPIAALRCRDVVSDGIMFGASMDGGRI